MVASRAEAIAMGIDKVQGSSFERGEDLGCFHTTVIFHIKNIYNSEFKGALDNLGLDFRKRNADLLVFISTACSLSLSLKENAPVTPLKANMFKRDYWKLEITILLHPGPTRHTLFRIAHDVCAVHFTLDGF